MCLRWNHACEIQYADHNANRTDDAHKQPQALLSPLFVYCTSLSLSLFAQLLANRSRDALVELGWVEGLRLQAMPVLRLDHARICAVGSLLVRIVLLVCESAEQAALARPLLAHNHQLRPMQLLGAMGDGIVVGSDRRGTVLHYRIGDVDGFACSLLLRGSVVLLLLLPSPGNCNKDEGDRNCCTNQAELEDCRGVVCWCSSWWRCWWWRWCSSWSRRAVQARRRRVGELVLGHVHR